MIADYYSVFAEYSSKILVLSLEDLYKNEFFGFLLVVYTINNGVDSAVFRGGIVCVIVGQKCL